MAFPKETKLAFYFVLLLGIVSLFSDMTYEGARSVIGPYLSFLGAGATIVGFVVGFGEFLGYGLRFFAGYLVDRSKRYWEFIILGYLLSLLAIPALALVNSYEWAVLLLLLERLGKALRTPPRDTLLSFATVKMGQGFGFGLHEAMDQIGAVVGPLLFAGILYMKGSYKVGFFVLLIPATFAIISLFVARRFCFFANTIPDKKAPSFEAKGFNSIFWWYLLGLCFVGAGFVSFALVGFHLHKTEIVSDEVIPLLYAMVMGVDALSALFLGILYDRRGLWVVLASVFVSIISVPLIFFGDLTWVFLGLILWGIGLGAQESILRAVVASLVPKERRASGYGVFHGLFGFSAFVGGSLLGFLYDHSFMVMVFFSLTCMGLSIPFLLKVLKIVDNFQVH